jgi:hypothetical protein
MEHAPTIRAYSFHALQVLVVGCRQHQMTTHAKHAADIFKSLSDLVVLKMFKNFDQEDDVNAGGLNGGWKILN